MFNLSKLCYAPRLETLLRDAGLLDIESVSQREFDWFEAPNKRRGGWSGVSRIVLNPEAPEGEQKAVFLKIQQNHYYRAPNTFLLKRLTFEREFAAMSTLAQVTDDIPEVILFAKWEENGNQGCILITESLEDWLPLGPWLMGSHTKPAPDPETFKKALEGIASTARAIHAEGWVHMCFSAKHLFLRQNASGDFDVRVVDLEKTRKRIGLGRRTYKDCSHFMRHTPKLSDKFKIHFLKAYFQTEHFTAEHKALIAKMAGAPEI